MKVVFKITRALSDKVRQDLHRPHPFAHERIGFISAGVSSLDRDILILARQYRSIPDNQYLLDTSVGAMMGPDAIRCALQWAMEAGHALFHVHTHGGQGIPGFSGVDIRENAKFVPSFFNVARQSPHGAIVLSDTAARGQIWFERSRGPSEITEFIEIGDSLRKWRPS